jgi:hypothetical protein
MVKLYPQEADVYNFFYYGMLGGKARFDSWFGHGCGRWRKYGMALAGQSDAARLDFMKSGA